VKKKKKGRVVEACLRLGRVGEGDRKGRKKRERSDHNSPTAREKQKKKEGRPSRLLSKLQRRLGRRKKKESSTWAFPTIKRFWKKKKGGKKGEGTGADASLK